MAAGKIALGAFKISMLLGMPVIYCCIISTLLQGFVRIRDLVVIQNFAYALLSFFRSDRFAAVLRGSRLEVSVRQMNVEIFGSSMLMIILQ